MNRDEIEKYLYLLKCKLNVKIYTPYKYFQGLKTKKEIYSRFEEMLKHKYNKNMYSGFSTDFMDKKYKSTKPSIYTREFHKRYGKEYTTLQSKSDISGIPYSILKKVYNKGKAAWRLGHRVGATQSQWAYARVNSFITFGCTLFTADYYLFLDALHLMSKKNIKRWLSYNISCPNYQTKKFYHDYIIIKQKYL